jgi:hypothetical protein
MSEAAKASARARAIKAALLIVALGPLVGSMLLLAFVPLWAFLTEGGPMDELVLIPMSVVLALVTAPVAYILGGPFALVAAALAGIWIARGNRVTYLAALLLAAITCAIALAGGQVLQGLGLIDGALQLKTSKSWGQRPSRPRLCCAG